MESEAFSFKSVFGSITALPGAFKPLHWVEIEDQGELRTSFAHHSLFKTVDERQVTVSGVPLISARGVHKTIADQDISKREGWTDQIAKMAIARSIVEKRLGFGTPSAWIAIDQNIAQHFGLWRAPWLARGNAAEALLLNICNGTLNLRRFPSAFASLKGNEDALRFILQV